MRSINNIKGLILTEALISMATLVIASVVMSTIIQNSLSTTTMARDYMIAQNLATEAIEAVKVIRDTNMMIRPPEVNPGAASCWLTLNPEGLLVNPPPVACPAVAQSGSKYIVVQTAGRWKMVLVGGNVDLNLGSPNVNPIIQKLYALFLVNGRYIQTLNPLGTYTESQFYRRVRFTNIAVDGSSATIEVKVEWKNGKKIRNVIRTYTLFNTLE